MTSIYRVTVVVLAVLLTTGPVVGVVEVPAAQPDGTFASADSGGSLDAHHALGMVGMLRNVTGTRSSELTPLPINPSYRAASEPYEVTSNGTETAVSTARATNATVYVGSNDGTLYAVDAATGNRQWSFDTGTDTVTSSPTVRNGIVYVIASYEFNPNRVYAIDAATGQELWTFALGPRVRVVPFSPTDSSPTVVGGTVYVSSMDGKVYALDAATGSEEWAFDTGFAVYASPNVIKGTVYVTAAGDGLSGAQLYALDAATGSEEWTFDLRDTATASPTVAGGTVYASKYDSDGNAKLYAVDATTGEQQWVSSIGAFVRTAPTVVNGTAYIGNLRGTAIDGTGKLVALDADNGSRQWTFDGVDDTDSSPTVSDGVVYVGSDDGNLRAIDADTGTERWSAPTNGDVVSSPTVANGTVYVGSNDNRLYAVDADTGTERWSVGTNGSVVSSPTVVATPTDGKSVGSRVNLGTLGHHDVWAGRQGDDITVPVESVAIEFTPTPPTNQTPVAFAANVTPTEASVDRVRWTFGDNTTATGRQAVHTFEATGNYTVTTEVRRDGSTVATATRDLNVTALNITEAIILGVSTEPRGPLPRAPGVNKTVQAFVTAPDGVDRVVFQVGDDSYTDADGSDGWTVTVPVAQYEPGTTVTVRVVGADGTEDTVTRGLGIASVGEFIQFVLDNVDTSSTAASHAGVRPQVVRTLPDRTVISVVWPPPFAPDDATLNLVVTRLGIELSGATEFVVYTERGGATEFGGQLAGELEAQPYKITGKGSLRARNNFSRDGGPFTIETDSVDLKLVVSGGLIKSFSPMILGYGVDIEVFLGPRVSLDGRFENAAGFPLNVDRGRASLSLEASGEFETDIKAGSISGSTTGRAGVRKQGGFSVSELLSNITAVGQFVVQGQADLLVFRNSFRETFQVNEPITSASMAVNQSRVELRPHEGTTPLADDSRAATAETDANDLLRGVHADRFERLTRDGLADESPKISVTRDGYLLAWDRQPPNRTVLEGHDIYVRAAGAGSDAAFAPTSRVTNDTRVDVDPDLATNGSGGALLTWTRLNRTFDNRSHATPNRTFAAQEIGVSTAVTAGSRTPRNWTEPRVLTDAPGAAFRPRVGHAAGQYYLVWRYDADGRPRTFGDDGIRAAPYNSTTGSLGPVTTLEGATTPRVAGRRLAFFQPDATGGRNGTVVVRNLSTGTQRTTDVTDFKDLAISTETVAWVAGEGPEEEVRYWPADGSVGTVQTRSVSGINDIELVTRQTSGEGQVDILVFDARETAANSTTSDTKVYYRVRQGDLWGHSRPLTTGETDLTFVDISAAGRDGGLVTVFSAANVSSPTEMPDLFSVRNSYQADLNVSASLTAPRNVTPGDQIQLNWQVQNTGASAARDATVLIEDSTGVVQRISGGALAEIPPGESVTRQVQFSANRSRNLTVRVTGATGDTRRSNDTTVLSLMRPDLRLATIELAPTRGGVAYQTTVLNEGPVTAHNVTPGITNNRQLVTNTSVGDLPPGDSAAVRLVALTNRTNAGLVTRVMADPTDGIEESNETTGSRKVVPPRPDLFVDTVGIEAVAGRSSGTSQLDITVGNRGFAGTNAVVRVTAGDRTLTRNVSFAGTRANASRFKTLRIGTDAISLSSGQEVTVEIRPLTIDARPVDNLASTSVGGDTRDGPPPIVGDYPPQDLNGDGLYRDINGDGEFSIGDVQSFFQERESDVVQNNPKFFNFDGGDPADITIADIQALFLDFVE